MQPIFDLNLVEPFFPDIHTPKNGYSTASDDILSTVQACPVLAGQDTNEAGEDCEACNFFDPDRGALCQHIQMGRPLAVSPDLDVWFKVGEVSW